MRRKIICHGNRASEANNEVNNNDAKSEQDGGGIWILCWAETQRGINGRKSEGSDEEVRREIRDQGIKRSRGGSGKRGGDEWQAGRERGRPREKKK